jgi:hypothetical protein
LSGQTCHDDQQVTRVVADLPTYVPAPHDWEWANFTLLIIDESQDIRPDMLRIIHFLITDVCHRRKELRLVFLGDPRQLLYNFYARDRADDRFLTASKELFEQTNLRAWETVELTRSFRSTRPVAEFMNLLVRDHDMEPREEEVAAPVRLVVCDVYRDPQWLILPIVKQWKNPEDIMILCPSLNERSPARTIVDKLVQHHVPIHVARSGGLSDTAPHTSTGLSPERGKIRVKTFCSAKGLEANVVIVINPRGLFGNDMNNALYVALTRSVKHLIIFQSSAFVTWKDLETLTTQLPVRTSVHIDVHRPLLAQPSPDSTVNDRPSAYLSAESMFHYVDPRCLEQLVECLDITMLRGTLLVSHSAEEGDDAYARSMEVVTVEGLSVNVRKLTGSALTLAAEYYGRGKTLPASVLQLSSRVQAMVDHGRKLLTAETTSFSPCYQRWCHLQAFQHFAIAIDVDTGFSDKATELIGHAFVLSPFVFRRLDLLLKDVQTYVESPSSRWHARLSKKHLKVRLSARPTVVTSEHVFLICDRPTTTGLADLAEIGMCLALSNRQVAFVSNVHSGELVRIELSSDQVDTFLTQAIESKMNREETCNDVDFVKRFKLGEEAGLESVAPGVE